MSGSIGTVAPAVAIGRKTREDLEAGRVVRGEFAPAGTDLVAAGTLTWTSDDGAELDLIGDTLGWPGDLGGYHHTVHGVLNGQDRVTLRLAGVRRLSIRNRATKLSSTTLVLGGHVNEDDRWSRATYGTTNLSEWIGDSGLLPQLGNQAGGAHGMLWKQPHGHQFELPRADASLVGYADMDPWGFVPSWSVATSQRLVVNLRRRALMDDLHDRYAIPLLSLLAFAADRPESLLVETLHDPGRNAQVEVWRQGPRFAPRDWQPGKGFLFRAADLPRLTSAMRKWWRIYNQTWPALGMFAEHITDGRTYAPSRFLTLYTAAEGFARVRLGQSGVQRMREFAGVDDSVLGHSKQAYKLIAASRVYFAHLNARHLTQATINDGLLDSTRRLHALMQACLLRELGFGRRQATTLLENHQFSWPLPT